jgi:hypothetical protein
MTVLSTILSLIPAILTIISFAFTVLTTTNGDWAHQPHYTDASPLNWDQKHTAYTISRGPFTVCSPFATYTNGTPVADNFFQLLNAGSDAAVAAVTSHQVVIQTHCDRFKPYGAGKTSCETFASGATSTDSRLGDDRMCQQVHMAGNLAIAASVFSGLALLTMLAFAGLALASSTSRAAKAGLGVTSVVLLLLGAALLFLAQLYGVLAFVQSQVPNGRFSSQAQDPDSTSVMAGPWVQGKASVIYASVGWFGACCAAATLLATGVVEGLTASTGVDGEVVGERGLWHGRRSRRDKQV